MTASRGFAYAFVIAPSGIASNGPDFSIRIVAVFVIRGRNRDDVKYLRFSITVEIWVYLVTVGLELRSI